MKPREIWTIGAILKWTGQYFSQKGVDNPRLDAEVLLSHILKKDRVYLYVHFDQPLEEAELAAYRNAVKKRAARIPVAYITGQKEFMGLNFVVNPAVLIPRPDTEILVEQALHKLKVVASPTILDIGTGSGAVIISVLANLSDAAGATVDISREALAIAKDNAAAHKLEEKISFYQGDLFQPVQGQCFDAILSNPPYIPDADIAGLEPEVLQEPRTALAGGTDGLDFYRRLVAGAPRHLKPGGFLAVEVGIGQAVAVAQMAQASNKFAPAEISKDYGGIERVVIMKMAEI